MTAPDRTIANSPPLVLLANGQEWSARSLESVLGPNGFATLRAYTGKQALELSRTARADAFIVEAGLPDLSGVQLCRLLRDEPTFETGTPIILLSSETITRAQRLEAYRAGAWEYFSEPFDVEALALKLGLMVSAKRAASHAAQASLVDPATGLYSFKGLAHRAREIAADALRHRSSVACIAFSVRADSIPEVATDVSLASALTRHVGGLASGLLRASDVLGILGRSELAIVASHTDDAGAQQLVKRLQSLVRETPLTVGGRFTSLRLSSAIVAVADLANGSMDLQAMLLKAATDLRRQRATDPDLDAQLRPTGSGR